MTEQESRREEYGRDDGDYVDDSYMSRNPERDIERLPDDVVAQIKSTIVITSLIDVVVHLLKNALDAGASKVEAMVDFRKGGCGVEDNGLGILPTDFDEGGGLGKLHHTSKHAAPNELYGRNGSFLASLASLCVLTVSSRHHEHYSKNTITFHKSRVIRRESSRARPYASRPTDQGTSVTVKDLFGSMPVRVKQRAALEERTEADRQWSQLQRAVTTLLVAWNKPVTLALRDANLNKRLVLSRSISDQDGNGPLRKQSRSSAELRCTLRVLEQSGIAQPEDSVSWIPIAASSDSMSVKGLICQRPAPTKSAQFISLGIHSLSAASGHNELFAEVNRIFDSSSFGIVDDSEPDEEEKDRRRRDKRFKSDGFTNRQLKRPSKGVDRWAMFVFRITSKEGQAAHQAIHDESLIQTAIELLSAMTTQWLQSQGYRIHSRRQRRHNDSERSTPSKVGELKGENGSPRSQTPSRTHTRPASSAKSLFTGIQSFNRLSNRLSRIKSGQSAFYDTAWAIRIPNPKADMGRMIAPPSATRMAGPPHNVQNDLLAPVNIEANCQGAPGEGSKPKDGTQTVEHALDIVDVDPRSLVGSGGPDLDDGTILWHDPFTKERHRINARTGAVALQKTLDVTATPTTARYQDATMPSLSITDSTERKGRVRRVQADSNSLSRASSSWLTSFLQQWENPVFSNAEVPINSVLDCGPSDFASKQKTCGVESLAHGTIHRLSRESLARAVVLAQVDKKFILVKVPPSNPSVGSSSPGGIASSGDETLVLIDQHAADERVRVESLLGEFSSPSSRTALTKPIILQLRSDEVQLLEKHVDHFAAWNIHYSTSGRDSVPEAKHREVHVAAVPSVIAQRMQADPPLLLRFLRGEIWRLADDHASATPINSFAATARDSMDGSSPVWLKQLASMPAALLDMVNSRACRSACMFNDELSPHECEKLVGDLAACVFPFMCAHGRPSMVPLVAFGSGRGVQAEKRGEPDDDVVVAAERDFASAFKTWRDGKLDGVPGGA